MTRAWLLAAALAALAATAARADDKRAPLDPDKPEVAAAGDKKGPPPAEYTLTVKEGAWRVRVTLRPGQPEPGQKLELLFDVARHPDIPDPQYGDRIPLQGARLFVTMSGAGRPERHRLWPMGDSGVYGTHWTPSERGLWTVSLAPIDPKADAPTLDFQLGAAVPMPASSEGQAVRSTRVVRVGARPSEAGKPTLEALMKQLGARWLELGRGLPEADEKAALAAIMHLVSDLAGSAPRGFASDSAEFDNIARKLKADVELYAAGPAEARAQQLSATETETCLRCHVKFRDGVVSDVSKWPEVTPWRK